MTDGPGAPVHETDWAGNSRLPRLPVFITLDVEPAYDVRRRVSEGLSRDALLGDLDAITAGGDSVSVFTRWGGEAVEAVRAGRHGRSHPPGHGDPHGARRLPLDEPPARARDHRHPLHVGARSGGGRRRPRPRRGRARTDAGAPTQGKLFLAGAAAVAPLCERLPDFARSPIASTRVGRSATGG
jgi:hypothetical protein